MDVAVAKKILTAESVAAGKELLHGIVSMLVGLARSISDRAYEAGEFHEASDPCRENGEGEQEHEQE